MMWIALCLDYKLLLPHKLLFSTVVPRVSPLLLQLCLMVPLQGLFLLELKNPASASAASNGFISRFVLVLVGTQKPASASAVSDGSITRYDLYSGTIDAIGNHQDMASCVGYSIETCHVISAGLDKKVMSWDTRLANPLALFRNLGAEIDSISISGFDLIVAVGAAVSIYDLGGTMKGGWPGGRRSGMWECAPSTSQIRIPLGANNSFGPADLGEAHESNGSSGLPRTDGPWD